MSASSSKHGESAMSSSASAQQSRPRTRKRSLFGKASKPAVPPLDSLPVLPNAMRTPSMSSVASTASQQATTSSTPSRPPALHSHARSPSTSKLESTEIDHVGSGDSDNPTWEAGSMHAQSLGRSSTANLNAGSLHSPWYQRNPLSRSSFGLLGGGISPNRARSASVTDQVRSNRPSGKGDLRLDVPQSPQVDGTLHRWTGPGSPSQLRRTFSRRSVFSVQSESASREPESESSQQKRGDVGEELNGTKEKRKLFGRSNRTRAADASPSLSSNHASDNLSECGITASLTDRQTSVREAGNDSLLRPASSSVRGSRDDFMASSDSLASTSTNSTSRGFSKRASEVLNRTTQFAHRSRRGNPAVSSGMNLPEAANAEGAETEPATLTEAARTAVLDVEKPLADEAIPKRLSGWLSHMLSSDGSHSELKMSDSVVTLKKKTSAMDAASGQGDASRSISPVSQLTTGRAVQSSAITPRSRTAGLLSTLAASGRARTEAAQTTNGYSGGARSGLDRALRYFLDSHDEAAADEGIWLLGVWHGPVEERSISSTSGVSEGLAPAAVVSGDREALPSNQGDITAASSKQCSDLEHDDNSSLASSAQRTRATSPSTASGSSRASAPKKHDTVVDATEIVSGDEEEAIFARNPPTPHASPYVPHRKALMAGRQNDATTESGSSFIAAIAISAEKTKSFQADFSSRIWCTYRSHFTPISRDGTISREAELSAAETASTASAVDVTPTIVRTTSESSHTSTPAAHQSAEGTNSSPPIQGGGGGLSAAFGIGFAKSTTSHPSPSSSNNPSATGGGLGEKMGIPGLWTRATAAAQAYGFAGRTGLTTDAGWGCMLRTGQSLLANALLTVHLGRDWRRIVKPLPSHLAPRKDEGEIAYQQWQQQRDEHARYTRLLSWFMDEPSLACPFGVHRMAREGKRLGKEVGEWFGPSTAAGAIQRLVDEFPACKLGVSVASDGVIYLDQVTAQAQSQRLAKRSAGSTTANWLRPVLILIGVRLGLEGVHPMYHDSVKATFSFPQSVGIAGGRPSSSYYFVGYQGNSLFYLDPHHVRPSVPFYHPPPQREEDAEWWAQVHSEHDLATFHNDRPRRMPMKSLDPSMLLGFLIQDESSLQDFVARVKGLPRPIFSVQDSMPTWMMDDADNLCADEEKAIESISESSVEGELTHGSAGDIDGDEGDESLVAVDRNDLTSEVVDGNTSASITSLASRAKGKHVRRDRAAAFANVTPRSESATFEFIERHTHASAQPPVPPIAFPTRESFDEVERMPPPSMSTLGTTNEKHYTAPEDDSYDHPPQPRRITADEAQFASVRDFSVGSGSDIDSAWEDVQPDVQSSPQSALYVLRRHDSTDDTVDLGPPKTSPATSLRKANS